MLQILYQDKELIVAIKPSALVSESTEGKDGFADLLAAEAASDYIGVVHRLDRGVGGVMVYAKTKSAAAALSSQMTDGSFQKEYLAMIHGKPVSQTGEYRDLLFHDRYKNKTYVTDRKRGGVKEARLAYRVEKTVEHPSLGLLSLVSVRLFTGRTHQIRVQFASRQHPLLGDRKYGAPPGVHEIGLFCRRISFLHPSDRTPLSFSFMPSGIFSELFGDFLEKTE